MVKVLQQFFKATPQIINTAIAFTLIFVGSGIGFAVGKSNRVEFSEAGLLIEQQAIANHKDLERSLLIIKIQQGLIERQEANLLDFSQKYVAGEELAQQAKFAAEVIPPQQIEQLENRINESQKLLDENLVN